MRRRKAARPGSPRRRKARQRAVVRACCLSRPTGASPKPGPLPGEGPTRKGHGSPPGDKDAQAGFPADTSTHQRAVPTARQGRPFWILDFRFRIVDSLPPHRRRYPVWILDWGFRIVDSLASRLPTYAGPWPANPQSEIGNPQLVGLAGNPKSRIENPKSDAAGESKIQNRESKIGWVT